MLYSSKHAINEFNLLRGFRKLPDYFVNYKYDLDKYFLVGSYSEINRSRNLRVFLRALEQIRLFCSARLSHISNSKFVRLIKANNSKSGTSINKSVSYSQDV